jgi:hypothetical protein
VLPGQEQADEVVAEGLAGRPAIEEVIELGAERVDGISGAKGGLAGSRHG